MTSEKSLAAADAWNHFSAPVASSFTLKDSLKLPEIEKLQESGKIEQILMPVDAGFMQYPCVSILEEQEKILRNGNPFRVREIQNLLPEGRTWMSWKRTGSAYTIPVDSSERSMEYREKGIFPVKMFYKIGMWIMEYMKGIYGLYIQGGERAVTL